MDRVYSKFRNRPRLYSPAHRRIISALPIGILGVAVWITVPLLVVRSVQDHVPAPAAFALGWATVMFPILALNSTVFREVTSHKGMWTRIVFTAVPYLVVSVVPIFLHPNLAAGMVSFLCGALFFLFVYSTSRSEFKNFLRYSE